MAGRQRLHTRYLSKTLIPLIKISLNRQKGNINLYYIDQDEVLREARPLALDEYKKRPYWSLFKQSLTHHSDFN